jgi:hypothetical protein
MAVSFHLPPTKGIRFIDVYRLRDQYKLYKSFHLVRDFDKDEVYTLCVSVDGKIPQKEFLSRLTFIANVMCGVCIKKKKNDPKYDYIKVDRHSLPRNG